MKELKPTNNRFLDPMRSKVFLIGWTVNVISSIGTHIHNINERLQMAQSTTSPLLMTLLDAGNYLPVVLLAFSAGALADTIDRRRLLIASQSFMLLCAALLSSLTFLHLVTPNILLISSLLLGIGSALTMPAYQSIIPEIIGHEHLLAEGIIINSVGYNLSRAIGPAIGGYLFDKFGAGCSFAINSLSFSGVVIALLFWKRFPYEAVEIREPILNTMKIGFQYIRHSRPFKAAIIWAFGYCFCGSVVFLLTPSLAIHTLKLSPKATGCLMSCIGIGAAGVMLILPKLRTYLKTNTMLLVFGLTTVLSHLLVANTKNVYIMSLCLIIVGMSWLTVISTISLIIQVCIPSNLKARTFGAYHMLWGTIMTFGAAFWGKLASVITTPITIEVSSFGMLCSLIILNRLKIADIDQYLDTNKNKKSLSKQ